MNFIRNGCLLLIIGSSALAQAQGVKTGTGTYFLAPKGQDKSLPQAPLRTEAMQKTETERDEPGQPLCQTRPAVPGIQDFGSDENDAKRDACLDGRSRHVHESERCRGEGDAVRNGERRHGDGDAPPIADQDYQRQDQQQVIEAEQDMLDT